MWRLENGDYLLAAFHATMAVSDFYIVRAAVVGGINAAERTIIRLTAAEAVPQTRNVRAVAQVFRTEAQMAEALGPVTARQLNLQILGQTSCFVAGTPLLTPTGDRPIESFRVGDQVLSRAENDPNSPVEVQFVEETFTRSSPILNLQIAGQTIRTTAEHPFFVKGKGWRCAKELEPGDLLSSHDEKWTPVETVTDSNEVATVYNLRISEHHTYFVGNRDWGFSVWAHNANYVLVAHEGGFRFRASAHTG